MLSPWHNIEFKTIAALEATVDRGHEIFVALPAARCARNVVELILPEALPDMQRPDWPSRPRLPIRTQAHDVDAGSRHESKRWVERITDALVLECSIPQVVWIVDLEPRSRSLPAQQILSSCG